VELVYDAQVVEARVPASRKRVILAIYLDFILFSLPWALVEYALHTRPEWRALSTPVKFVTFALLELLLHRVIDWSPGRWLLSMNANGVDAGVKSRESWITLLAGVVILLEGTKQLVRWSMWTPSGPWFGTMMDPDLWPLFSTASGLILCAIAYLFFRLHPAAPLAGVAFFGTMLASAVMSAPLWKEWLAESITRRRAYQGLPVRPGEIEQMQSMAPGVVYAGIAFYLLLVIAAGAVIMARRPRRG
jgi:hypothetical protein